MTKTMFCKTVTMTQGDVRIPSFQLVPINKDCPYNECTFYPESKIMALISKEKKNSFEFLPKLNDDGDMIPAKRKRLNGKSYAEQRMTVETYYENYIETPEEIASFINQMAVNPDFNFYEFLTPVAQAA